MCYHASVSATFEQLSNHYQKPFEGEFPMFFNPKAIVGYHLNGFNHPWLPIISQQSPETFTLAQWGLIPNWIKSWEEAEKLRVNTLNAKIETLLDKPSFREAAITQRCLIPMTGFFEWQQINAKEKQPYFIYLKNQAIFSMAGISELWVNPSNQQTLRTISIVTTEANAMMAEIHNIKKRMPIILSKESESLWLTQTESAESIIESIKSVDENLMQAYKIGKLIGSKSTNTNTPEVLKEFIEPQTKLF